MEIEGLELEKLQSTNNKEMWCEELDILEEYLKKNKYKTRAVGKIIKKIAKK